MTTLVVGKKMNLLIIFEAYFYGKELKLEEGLLYSYSKAYVSKPQAKHIHMT